MSKIAISFVALATAISVSLPVRAAGYPRPGRTEVVDVTATGQTSRGTGGRIQDFGSLGTSITPSGRYVAFSSVDADLTPGDVNDVPDVFVRDRLRRATMMASVSSLGAEGIGESDFPSISSNGRFVAFESYAPNLVAGDTNLNADVFRHDLKTGRTVRVDVSSGGDQAKCPSNAPDPCSGYPSISANGRSIAFVSAATNLDTRHLASCPSGASCIQVFLHDMRTGGTTMVSVSRDGTPVDGGSDEPSISANGRSVAFRSAATNLVSGDTNLRPDVFVRDLGRGTTTRVSVASDGSQTFPSRPVNDYTGIPALSANGRYVAFQSSALNLVPNESGSRRNTIGWNDVFVHDIKTGRTYQVSVASDGTQYDCTGGAGNNLSISPDGRYVAYMSSSFNLTTGQWDASCAPHFGVMMYDRTTGTQQWVSASRNGRSYCVFPFPNPGGSSASVSISAGGRYVSFKSCNADLVAHDTGDAMHTYVRHVGPALGADDLASSGSLSMSGTPSFSSTGLESVHDPAGDLSQALTRQGADLIGASIAYRPSSADLFARLELQDMPSFPDANPALVYGLDLTVGGVSYEVRAAKTGSDSPASAGGASFGLFRRDGVMWTEVTTLRGGYGTTGDEVVFSLPLRDVGLAHGGRLRNVRATTSLGTYDSGSAVVLDWVRL